MAITFPSSPSTGQVFTVGNRSWTWDGSSWKGGVSSSGDATTLDSIDSTQFLRSDADDSITGQIIFPSTNANKPVFPQGLLARADQTDTTGFHDIWGISERYYPSNSTAADAWGIRWSGTPNEIQFIGNGSEKFKVNLDTGAATATSFIGDGSNLTGLPAGYTDANVITHLNTKSLYFNGGNIGVGDSAPFSKLQVGGNTFSGANGMNSDSRVGISNHGSLTGLMLASTYNDSTYPEYGLVFVQGPSTSSYNVWSISPEGPAVGDSLHFIYASNTTNIHTATPKVTFDGNGRVGIGEKVPLGKLHVKDGDAGSITSNGAHDTVIIEGSGNTGINIFSPNTSYQYLAFGDTEGSNSGYVRYQHSNNQMVLRAGATDTVYINDGNVGIGDNSPAEKFTIKGDGARMTISSNDYEVAMLGRRGSSAPSWDRGYLRMKYDGTNTIILDTGGVSYLNGGNVGIGTETPRSALQVVSGVSRLAGGSARFGKNDITGGLFLHSDASTTSHYNWMITTQDTVNQGFEIIPSSAPGNIQFSTPAFVITGDDRNVGIGTSGPGYRLHAYHPTTNVVGKIESGDDEVWLALADVSTDNYGTLIGRKSSTNTLFKVADEGVVERFTILEGGNVGIGTSTPTEQLHLYKAVTNGGHHTYMKLHQYQPDLGGIGEHGSFIDFDFQDNNDNHRPQVQIGAELGNRNETDLGQISEGRGNFVVKTSDGASPYNPAYGTSATEVFRVTYDGYINAKGAIINSKKIQSSTGTNSTNTSAVVIAASSITMTKRNHDQSRFLYSIVLSHEVDGQTTNTNGFLKLEYRIPSLGQTSFTALGQAITVGGMSDYSGGTNNNSFQQIFTPPNFNKNETIEMRLVFSKNNAQSVYFNQQNLASQPSGTSNHALGYVLEMGL